MSLRNSNDLEALVQGHHCHFNGDVWTTPDPELTKMLNGVTELVIRQDGTTSEDIARFVFHMAGLETSARILH